MLRCTCGCQDVEASIEKLQALLAMESHLDEELDELEKLFQLDQLKYEWLMREGKLDLCGVIKQQMQKTESLLHMYRPMLQETFAEKEAYITHILAVQQQRQLAPASPQNPQHQHVQQENLQEQFHKKVLAWRSERSNCLVFEDTSMPNKCGYFQEVSGNSRLSLKTCGTTTITKEKSSCFLVEELKNGKNRATIQQKECRAAKRKFTCNISQKRNAWKGRRRIRCNLHGIQRHCNSPGTSFHKLKAKAVRSRMFPVFGQFNFQNSFVISRPTPRKIYYICSKTEKNGFQGLENSSAVKSHQSMSTAQFRNAMNLSAQKSLPRELSLLKCGISCKSAKYADVVNNPIFFHINFPSALESNMSADHMPKLPGQGHSLLPYSVLTDHLHKRKEYFNSKQRPPQSHEDQGGSNPNAMNNPSTENKTNCPSMNNTRSVSLLRVDMPNTTLNIGHDEQNYISIYHNFSTNMSDGFNLLGADHFRD